MGSNVDKVYDFVAIGELADTVKQIINLNLTYDLGAGQKSGIEKLEQMMLQQAREYLSQVREGFVLSVRSADVADHSELHYLVERVLLDWSALHQELGLTEDLSAELASPEEVGAHVERVRGQLLAFGMAAIALGALPRLPKEEVTFPRSYSKPATYADIPAPRSPGEMLHRIEELEQMIWQIGVQDASELVLRKYGSLRRTYGFFESSAYLARKESERFGMKPSRRLL